MAEVYLVNARAENTEISEIFTFCRSENKFNDKNKVQTQLPKPDAETSNVTNPQIANEVSKFHLAVKVH